MEVAKFVEENTQAAIIDINMGCPVNKIIKAEAGAKWFLDPNKVHEMVHAVSSAVSLPVTVKMRTGWDEDHLYAVDNALSPNKRALRQLLCMVGHVSKCTKGQPTGTF